MTSSFRIITFGFIFKILSCPIPPNEHIQTYTHTHNIRSRFGDVMYVNNVFIFKNKYSLKTQDTKRVPTPQTTIAGILYTRMRKNKKKTCVVNNTYGGTSPFSSPESKTLEKNTNGNSFSIHTYIHTVYAYTMIK